MTRLDRKTTIENARITGTSLGAEDHGILTCYLHLEYAGSNQGFGGYALDAPISDAEGKFLHREGSAYGMEFISRILDTLKVSSWEKLKGVYIRVEHDWGKVYRIGHIIEDRWFDPATLAKEMGVWDGD